MNVAGSITKAGAAALAGGIAVTGAATFLGETKPDQTASYWVVALFLVAVTVLVFGLVVLRGVRAPGTKNSAALSGLITSIAGLITIVAFWSGLPVVFGAAGALLGSHGLERARAGAGRGGMARTALVLGLLAILGAVASTIGDKLA